VLSLSDGTALELWENTHIGFEEFDGTSQTGVSRVHLKFWWGRMMSSFSTTHLMPGSLFTIQTPNALVDVKFPGSKTELMYDQSAKTTTVISHQGDVGVKNLFTGEITPIRQGTSGVVSERGIQSFVQALQISDETSKSSGKYPQSSPDATQRATAIIAALGGDVYVTIQGSAPVAAATGMILQAGDTIQTQAGARIVLRLAEGSELRLGQNTKIDIAALARRPKTQARKSRIKLLYGRIRAFLSPGYQKEDSAFTVETPNAVAGVKFSTPIVDVSFDPRTLTTIVNAYTVDVNLTNILTQEIRRIPRGSQGIIQGKVFRILPIPPETHVIARQEGLALEEDTALGVQTQTLGPPQSQSFSDILLRGRDSITSSTGSTVPGFGTGGERVGESPIPVARPERPGMPERQPHHITIILTDD